MSAFISSSKNNEDKQIEWIYFAQAIQGEVCECIRHWHENVAGSGSVAIFQILPNSCMYRFAISGFSMIMTFSSLLSVALVEKLNEPVFTQRGCPTTKFSSKNPLL